MTSVYTRSIFAPMKTANIIIRTELPIKEAFKRYCKRNKVTMTDVLNKTIVDLTYRVVPREK